MLMIMFNDEFSMGWGNGNGEQKKSNEMEDSKRIKSKCLS